MLTIGDFARVTHLTRKTLRHYHEAGLLVPDRIDPATGYRYYSTEQIPTAQVVKHFRELDMPVAEIRSLLLAPVDDRAQLIAGHLARLQEQLSQTQSAVVALQRLLSPTPPALNLSLRAIPARTVAAVSAVVGAGEVLTWYAGAMAELEALHLTETDAPGGVYDNELFTDERGRAVVYLSVAAPPRVGRVAPFTISAAELAIEVHRGSHADIDVTYGALGAWVADQQLAL